MKMNMHVTSEMLREKDACEDQVLIFEREWSDGIDVTLDSLMRAIDLGLDLYWFAKNFLPAPAFHKAIAPEREAYNKVIDREREVYHNTVAQERVSYHKTIASALESFHKTVASARESYDKVIDKEREVFHKAIALAIWEIIGGQHGTS